MSLTGIICNERCIFPKRIGFLNLARQIFAKKAFKSSNFQQLSVSFLPLFLCLIKHASLQTYTSKMSASVFSLTLIRKFLCTFAYNYKNSGNQHTLFIYTDFELETLSPLNSIKDHKTQLT